LIAYARLRTHPTLFEGFINGELKRNLPGTMLDYMRDNSPATWVKLEPGNSVSVCESRGVVRVSIAPHELELPGGQFFSAAIIVFSLLGSAAVISPDWFFDQFALAALLFVGGYFLLLWSAWLACCIAKIHLGPQSRVGGEF